MDTIGDIGELRLIDEWLRPRFASPEGWVGIGDDAALVPLGEGRMLAASTDRVPANFSALQLGAIGYRTLGRYLVALNVSDLVATGAVPLGQLLTLALPADFPLADFEELASGVAEGASSFGCPVLGGDMSDSAEMSLSATVFGTIATGTQLLRSGARPGDEVFFTGPIGAGAAILALALDERLRERHPAWRTWMREHFDSIGPRAHTAAALVRSGACSCCMDNTDGIAVSLHHLARSSSVGIRLDAGRLALHELARKVFGEDLASRLAALGPGVDLGLVGTLRPDRPGSADLSGLIHTIGTVIDGEGVTCRDDAGSTFSVDERGWEYFHS